MSAPADGQAPKTPTNADLGRTIRRLRHARRLSIEALAFMADMHCSYVKFSLLGGLWTWRGGQQAVNRLGRPWADHMPTGAMTSRSY